MRFLLAVALVGVLASCRAPEEPAGRKEARQLASFLSQHDKSLEQAMGLEMYAWKLQHEQLDRAIQEFRSGPRAGSRSDLKHITDGRATDFGRARDAYYDLLAALYGLPMFATDHAARLFSEIEGEMVKRCVVVQGLTYYLGEAETSPELLDRVRSIRVEQFPDAYLADGTARSDFYMGFGEPFFPRALRAKATGILNELKNVHSFVDAELASSEPLQPGENAGCGPQIDL